MKKIIISLVFGLIATGLWAQNVGKAKVVPVSQAIQKPGYTIQVGLPFLGFNNGIHNTKPADIRFPWDVLYLYSTFAEESFDVSKGYFGDKILITWDIRANIDLIKSIKIYKRVVGTVPYLFVGSVAATTTAYDDKYAEGGVLYEYKVVADGVSSTESLYNTYITGFGFRNPTAIVTGNVSFKGGNPVKDVVVMATAAGSTSNPGSSLYIPFTSRVQIGNGIKSLITNTLTYQAWVKPKNAFTTDNATAAIRLFNLVSKTNDSIVVSVNLLKTSNKLAVNVGGSTFELTNYFPSGEVNSRGDDIMVPVTSFNTSFIHFTVVMKNAMVPKLFINGRPITTVYKDKVNTIIRLLDPNQSLFAVTIPTQTNSIPTKEWNTINIGGVNDSYVDEIRIWNDTLQSKTIRTDYSRYISGNDIRLKSYLRANETVGSFAYDLSREGFTYNKNNGAFIDKPKIEEILAQPAIPAIGTTSAIAAIEGRAAVIFPPISWANGAGNYPTATQLGVLGVTDVNGNYEITAIPYSGTGESFTITPLYGQHKFEPNQQLVFLGQGSEVVNKIDFIDKSSFSFKGVVQYDTRGVFKSYKELNDEGDKIMILGSFVEGYNYYENLGTKYDKGEYWKQYQTTPTGISAWLPSHDYLEDANVSFGDNYYTVKTAGTSGTLPPTHTKGIVANGTATFKISEIVYDLYQYARVFTAGANVYIDGNIVLDANNIPVVTTEEGFFDVSVPIGNHYITVKKDGHVFSYNGRFPETPFKEFFEDSNEAVVFIDKTRVTVVGKVVGGTVEAAKKIGFGENGLVTKAVKDADGNTINLEISAKNNIGRAQFTLGFKSGGDEPTPITTTSFSTNAASGEYRVQLLPLLYVLKSTDLKIVNNTDNISIITSSEILDFSKVVTPQLIPKSTYRAVAADTTTTKVTGVPYHYEKSFIYRSAPVVKVISQTSDTDIKVGTGTPRITLPARSDTDNTVALIYTQLGMYTIEMDRYELYTNYDNLISIVDKVPVRDIPLIITNNLALEKASWPTNYATTLEQVTNGSSITYNFIAGIPSIVKPFKKSMSLKYNYKGNDIQVSGYRPYGIILGGKADESSTFVTEAPELPDIILRDPPGSNSFASIQKGQSISFTSEGSCANTEGFDLSIKLSFGLKLSTGLGVIIESETTNNIEVGIGLKSTSTNGQSQTKTYTFNKTISTSDDPSYDGSDGDLYIGKGQNIFYGTYDDISASTTIPQKTVTNNSTDPPTYTREDLPLLEYHNIGTITVPIYISKQKAVVFTGDSSSATLFVYSQKHILETLIPEYELFITNIDKYTVIPGTKGALTKAQYTEKIRLWRRIILNNEKNKYKAKTNPSGYQADVTSVLTTFKGTINDSIAASPGPIALANLKSKLSHSEKISTLLNDNFKNNISFDSGVGEFSQSVETTVVAASSLAYNLTTDQSFGGQIGVNVGGNGFLISPKSEFQQDVNSSLSEEYNKTTNISYTLKDNDPANYLSVDVINAFDGNGPIFVTKGGRTSCPHEGAELSHFYNNEDNLGQLVPIPVLEESRRVPLSFATQKVEVPVLSVTDANKSNITESKNAEFVLILENQSAAGADADYKLVVDNTTNPLNAIINIEPNGTIVHVPYGERVIYNMTLGKSISDKFNYDNIKVRLESLCDGEAVSSSVVVSAHFVPACSQVTVSTPLSNWVYNKNEAYSYGSNGAITATKPLPILLNGFSTSFIGFQKIVLEYRLVSQSNWTRLSTYYKNQLDFDAARNEMNKFLIGTTQTSLSYPFDIPAANLIDGNYEIRAQSFCSNGTNYISDSSFGSVDLHSPQRFGTPLPIDGILGAGEDLKVSFNEPISYRSGISELEIKGQTNQLPIDHNVSLHFEGAANTAVISNPRITSGDLTFEFWMNNSTPASTAAVILSQEEGVNIRLENGKVFFNIGELTANGLIATDNLFHHYTFTYKNSTGEVLIYQDDKQIGASTGNTNVQFSNNNDLTLGGNTFIGNMHDLRLWNKTINLADAYAKMYTKLSGNEANLIGYWPMDEGRGTLANDKARYKHALVNAGWDIKPKGTSYEFSNAQRLEFDKVGFVLLTKEMEATVSFWMKTPVSQEATLFSNGKGDGSDGIAIIQNKWAINMNVSGNLSFESEGKSYPLTSQNMADNAWHHVTLLFNRSGSLKTIVDGASVSSNHMTAIGGFSGNKIWLGARGSHDLTSGTDEFDRPFTGKLDEFQLWNTLRNEEQINRDRYNEIDVESIGLLFYARMNTPDPSKPTSIETGPEYFHIIAGNNVSSDKATLSTGNVSYATDVPAIKPERSLVKFTVNKVINQDAMIIEPVVTDWASLEGQVLDITVHRMYDSANNEQQSPITWTAYVKRNEVSWFAEGYNEIVDIIKKVGEEKSFDITVLNKGGKGQPFAITNIPKWLHLSKSTGIIAPDSKIIITATIDQELTPGDYLENLFLQTDFGYDEKLQVKLRVLAQEPDWTINPTDYKYSMNLVGRIKVDGKFSEDSYDKVAAFSNGALRGSAKLVYNAAYQDYFVFLTVYSNTNVGENIDFKIWNASQGTIIQATMDLKSAVVFEENGILGKLSTPVIFANSGVVEQKIALNNGWTWVSMNVNDVNFSNLNALTKSLSLVTSDRILSYSPARLDTYFKDAFTPSKSAWSGTISSNGGITDTKMFKVYMATEQDLTIKGVAVNTATWSFPIQTNWNWLPYVLGGNQLTNEALAYFDAVDGDVIKSQNLFAIYDALVGWNGTLNYLESGKGYMLKSSKVQTFKYPSYLSSTAKLQLGKNNKSQTNLSQETIKPEFKQYSDNMNAVVLLPKGYNELFVYDSKGVLKGSSKNQVLNNTELNFITVYGSSSETLDFYMGDGISMKKTDTNFSFKSNEVLGTISKPVILSDFIDNISIYPNPFENEITIKVDAVEDQTVILQLFSITSQLLFTQKVAVASGENKIKIQPMVVSGTYLLHVEMDGKTVINKVIKN